MGFSADQAAALDTKLADLSVHSARPGCRRGPRPRERARARTTLPSTPRSRATATASRPPTTCCSARTASTTRSCRGCAPSPGVRYVILVGRRSHHPPGPRARTARRSSTSRTTPLGGDLSGSATAVGQALQAKRFLSDDPLGLVTRRSLPTPFRRASSSPTSRWAGWWRRPRRSRPRSPPSSARTACSTSAPSTRRAATRCWSPATTSCRTRPCASATAGRRSSG